MEKRRLTSLRSVLLQYLVRTALACLLVAVGWLLVVLLWIQNSGLFLPANQAAQACQKAAQDVLPGMTAETFDETQLDSLWVLHTTAPINSRIPSWTPCAGTPCLPRRTAARCWPLTWMPDTCSGQWRTGRGKPAGILDTHSII